MALSGWVETLSLVGVTALAGCLGQGSDDGDGGDSDESGIDTSSPTAVVESWYPLFVEGSLDERQGNGPDLFHEESPRLTSVMSGKEPEDPIDNEFHGIETEVVEEGLSKEQIQQNGGLSIQDELATQIADEEETAMVEATYSVTWDRGGQQDVPVTLVVVTEDSKWQILWEL